MTSKVSGGGVHFFHRSSLTGSNGTEISSSSCSGRWLRGEGVQRSLCFSLLHGTTSSPLLGSWGRTFVLRGMGSQTFLTSRRSSSRRRPREHLLVFSPLRLLRCPACPIFCGCGTCPGELEYKLAGHCACTALEHSPTFLNTVVTRFRCSSAISSGRLVELSQLECRVGLTLFQDQISPV